MGSNDLDYRWRVVSISLPRQGHGLVHRVELGLEFLVGILYTVHHCDIDFRYGYVFAGCNILGGLVVYFFVIEGQGRTLEEIYTMYIQKVVPWQSNKWVAPPASEMARIRAEAGTGDVPRDVGERQDRGQSLADETERASDEVETQRGSGEIEKEAEHQE